jgi:hypothetical protein
MKDAMNIVLTLTVYFAFVCTDRRSKGKRFAAGEEQPMWFAIADGDTRQNGCISLSASRLAHLEATVEGFDRDDPECVHVLGYFDTAKEAFKAAENAFHGPARGKGTAKVASALRAAAKDVEPVAPKVRKGRKGKAQKAAESTETTPQNVTPPATESDTVEASGIDADKIAAALSDRIEFELTWAQVAEFHGLDVARAAKAVEQ